MAPWAAGVCFDAWLKHRGHLGPAEIAAGVEQVQRFFALHGQSRFSPDSGDDKRAVYERAGFIKGAHFWVYSEVFRSDIARGFDWRSLANALVERGILTPGEDEPDVTAGQEGARQ